MNSYAIMSYCDQKIGYEWSHSYQLCSPFQLDSVVFDSVYCNIIIHIPTHANQNIGHFCTILADRSEYYTRGDENVPTRYYWFDPIGKPPSFYIKDFPFPECKFDEHFSYVMPNSRSSGYHVLRFIENGCGIDEFPLDFYTQNIGSCGKTIDRNVIRKMKAKLACIKEKPTPEKLLLPGETRDILQYFYNREE